jgi:hypothetical protein
MHWVLDQSHTRSGAPKWRVAGLHVAAGGARRAACVLRRAVCVYCAVRRQQPFTQLWQHQQRRARRARDEQIEGAA